MLIKEHNAANTFAYVIALFPRSLSQLPHFSLARKVRKFLIDFLETAAKFFTLSKDRRAMENLSQRLLLTTARKLSEEEEEDFPLKRD
jgi:hypothetical protein